MKFCIPTDVLSPEAIAATAKMTLALCDLPPREQLAVALVTSLGILQAWRAHAAEVPTRHRSFDTLCADVEIYLHAEITALRFDRAH